MESTKQEILKAFYPTFIGVLIGLVLGGLLWIVARSPRGNSVELLPAPTPAPLVVDVAGAVPRPGVYELPKDSRVKDAVEAAGGFLAEADKANINLAAPVEDGQKLDIPFLAGTEPLGAVPTYEQPPELIDINKANLAELRTLPGMSESVAEAIIEYRVTWGLYCDITDLQDYGVPGITDDFFRNIQDLITASCE
jgi:competence protein ComEA